MKTILLTLAAVATIVFSVGCAAGTHSGSFSGGGTASGSGTYTAH